MPNGSVQQLRDAGIISDNLPEKLEDFYNTLTQGEVDVLVSTQRRYNAAMNPEVEAHSQDWEAPGSTQVDFSFGCACGLWSGGG